MVSRPRVEQGSTTTGTGVMTMLLISLKRYALTFDLNIVNKPHVLKSLIVYSTDWV